MKVGDKVKLNPDSVWNDGLICNPLNTEGEIHFIDLDIDDLSITVLWANGTLNSYNDFDLLLNSDTDVQECDATNDEQRTKS
jgi:hypothetical protein